MSGVHILTFTTYR